MFPLQTQPNKRAEPTSPSPRAEAKLNIGTIDTLIVVRTMATMTVGTANLAPDTTVIREAMVTLRMAAAMVAQVMAGAVMAKVAATVARVMVEGMARVTAAMVALVTAAGMVMVGRG
ncbi:hypothetical protein [Nitrobacter vulgaris]|uniref:hypothetical protein n=1 Tax=Nitrobacter vulgaris TaxID=29421 RepID=UPI00286C5D4B|nr:hypothetical protein [Nitrobacter vulgaris]